MKAGLGTGRTNVEYISMGQVKDGETKSMEFFKKRKNAAGEYEIDEIFPYGVTGHLLGIFNDSYSYGEETQKTFVFFMDIGGKVAKINMNQNYATRGLINSLCNVEDFDKMISMWTRLDKDSGYSRLWLKEDGRVYEDGRKTTSWKYEIADYPQALAVKVGSKTVKDLTEMENWFAERVKELNLRIGKMTDDKDDALWPIGEGAPANSNLTISEDRLDDEPASGNKFVNGLLSSIEMAADPSSLLGIQDAVMAKMSDFTDEENKTLVLAMKERMTALHGNPELVLEGDLPF